MRIMVGVEQIRSGPKLLGGPSKGAAKSGKRGMTTFNSALLKAVDLALIDTMGESGAAAVKFYIDTTLICAEPASFEESLRSVFGGSEKGQGLIEKKIEEALIRILSEEHSVTISLDRWEKMTPAKMKSLQGFVSACRKEYQASKLIET